MIVVKESNIKLKGKESIICGELGIIFNTLIEEIGERRTKRMINIALDTVIEENKKEYIKQQIKDKKALKARIQRDFPKEISDILCSLI